MVFHTNQRNVIYPNLVINNSIIERVSHFNFLGIMLSYNMTWDAHINHISKKISKAIGILYQLKHIYSAYIVYFVYNSDCTAFKLLPNFMGVIYQRKSSTALPPKEGIKNNYKQSLHSPFRTNFQRREMFKNYRHVFGSYLKVLFQAHEQQTAALLLFI